MLRCNGKSNVIMIVKVTMAKPNNVVIGGFSSVGWNSLSNYLDYN